MKFLTALPVYNEEKYLDDVLPQVAQFAGDVLVVDDGSTDRTPDILKNHKNINSIRHARNQGYGAGLATAFKATLKGGYDALVTIDCDGQHEPALIPELVSMLKDADIVSGSRYLKPFDPSQPPPEARRKINMTVLKWLSDDLDLALTDAFCGFKAYRRDILGKFKIVDLGYAMPLEVWVQAIQHRMKIVEMAVPLIYLDETRSFGGSLDDSEYRLKHYRGVYEAAMARAGLKPKTGSDSR